MTVRIVHYINQFFGQIGGEEKADIVPKVKEGPVGPGTAIAAAFKGQGEVVATVICGDGYFNENLAAATDEVIGMIEKYNPDLVIAGPAFNAGRYGVACGTVCKEVAERLGIPVVTGMYPENPGVEMFTKYTYIIETGDSAAAMRKAIPDIVKFAKKLVNKEPIGGPEEEGYIPRGLRRNYFAKVRGSQRAVDMLVKKLYEEDFVTEYPMPSFDRVEPPKAVVDITRATVALVTSGGIVPKNNPDHIEASSASKFGKYDIEGVYDLTPENFETAHGGYDPVYANKDADRVLPVDVLRDLEKEGKIGKLHRYCYSTVGNGTSVSNAKAFAEKFAQELVKDGVQAVILTST
jgi:glycine reductase